MANILIIEDETVICNLYKGVLEKAGHKVTLAKNGEEGLEQAKKDGFDLILLDIILPKLSGIDILKQLKEKEKERAKIVILTNYGQQINIKEALQLGARDVFIKYKITPEEAVEKIDRILS